MNSDAAWRVILVSPFNCCCFLEYLHHGRPKVRLLKPLL